MVRIKKICTKSVHIKVVRFDHVKVTGLCGLSNPCKLSEKVLILTSGRVIHQISLPRTTSENCPKPQWSGQLLLLHFGVSFLVVYPHFHSTLILHKSTKPSPDCIIKLFLCFLEVALSVCRFKPVLFHSVCCCCCFHGLCCFYYVLVSLC